jgi:hypothetical protein
MPKFHVLPLLIATSSFCSLAPAQTTQPSQYQVVGASITGASEIRPPERDLRSRLNLQSSEPRLVDVFRWAKAQAMDYAFDGDPVGPWYEAVEPGREGFCIRDTCHQALGAQALGLARYNLNMLHRFAENVSDSKDWCSYWEINRFNRPAPVDYENDALFWYNLPANFDLVDCCFRMYVWSGDPAYVNDPVFLNLYDRTVHDYVERWGLAIDQIMKRPRLLNVRGVFDPTSKFQKARGLPGYDEHDKTYVLGFDVIATQYAAFRAYANIQGVRGNADLSAEFDKKADAVEALAKSQWWDAHDNTFFARLNADYQVEGADSGRRTTGLDWGTVPYTDPDAEAEKVLSLDGLRLEYPEVSFTRIGAIVSGTMGINVVFTSPLLAWQHGYWVEAQVQTLSGLGSKIAWAQIENLPIRDNLVTVRHDGMQKTTFTNQHGPALIWLATFAGAHDTLLVNGNPMKAEVDQADPSRVTSHVRVAVGAGGSITVEIPGG